MRIKLKIMGTLKKKEPPDNTLELTADATITDALTALQIPHESVQVFTVNGQLVRQLDHPLVDGDQLTILPPVGGG